MKQIKLRIDGLTVEQLAQLVINNQEAISLMSKTYNESTSSAFKRSVTSKVRQHQQVIGQLQQVIRNLEVA
jgi:hypothetical protein